MWWLLASCVVRREVESMPSARLTLPDGSVVATPATFRAQRGLFRRARVIAAADRHRSLEIVLRGRRTVVVLVPEHGAVGTWTADEVP